jgi:hypothetical protein
MKKYPMETIVGIFVQVLAQKAKMEGSAVLETE